MLAPEHRAPYLGPDAAWTRGNATAATLLAAISLAGLLVAWVGASGKTHLEDEVPWLVTGVIALAVGGLGASTWLGRGLRSVRAERVALRRRLLAMDVGHVADAATADVWVTAAGMTRVHRPDCEYVRGKAVSVVAANAATPCLVCAA